ncbi:single-stranded DNA-binding protein [Calothrix sp. PCC 7507]|uniref:single-stranded DNA-binding protein n=1 Tax=Calothrix sp. PCC 7507 TaxID=99598 RepID=UPI00029F39CF|nr:single-stranded DNA-binding protein [Calothrix sp. PCC 7507]AFY32415.1 single-strand binding protein [Calothrix sp. PCC 7507]
MNSCVLLAEIIQEPQLRFTADNLEVTEMLVQFPNSLKVEDPPATLKVVSWGNLAKDIQQNYHEGDRVILVGRLGMQTIERPEGFKEKRAELTVQQIQTVGSDFNLTASPSATRNPAASETASRQPAPVASRPPETNIPNYDSPRPAAAPVTSTAGVIPQVNNSPATQPANFERTTYPAPQEEPNVDDIPF